MTDGIICKIQTQRNYLYRYIQYIEGHSFGGI